MTTPQLIRPSAVHTDSLLEPYWAEVTSITKEIEGVSTYWLKFTDPSIQKAYSFQPGQFNMVYLPGFGEAAISISSDPKERSTLGHTIRFAGNVTRAVSRLKVGDTLGLRGPFGSNWPMQDLEGKDVFIACGGIGLPPLTPSSIPYYSESRKVWQGYIALWGTHTH